jgi:hypothetical protein
MRKVIVSFVLAASIAVVPSVSRAASQGDEVAFSLVSAMCNLFYTPAKGVVAAVGLPVGAVAGFLNGGDTRAAYAIWVPTAGGSYFLTADMMNGKQPVEFFGSDYADRPGRYGQTHHGSGATDAKYVTQRW